MVGHNILDCLAQRREQFEIIATNSEAEAPGIFQFDRLYLSPTTCGNPAGFEALVLKLLEQEAPDLVIPCRDDDILFLAQLREKHPELAPKLLCGSVQTAAAMCDKYLSWEFSQAHNLPFAPTLATPAEATVAQAFARTYGFPLLAKPRQGFAGHGVFFILNEAQLQRAIEREQLVIQKFLGDPQILQHYLDEIDKTGVPLFHSFEGRKHSVQIHIAPDGEPSAYFASYNQNRNGTSIRLERYTGSDTDALAQCCHEAFSAAGWRGPINIQSQRTPEGQLCIYEYNGRISGATAARYHMGFDEIGLIVKHFLGREIPAPAIDPTDKVLRRMLDQAIEYAPASQFKRDGVWPPENARKGN